MADRKTGKQSASESDVISAGSRIGVYEVTAQIGAGGMGEVYRARDSRLGRDVAIKVLPPALSVDPDRDARFEREARTLASLNHPHIAAIYGFEEAAGVRAIVLELVEGVTLADRIGRGPIPLKEALPIGRQIADALDAAHEKGIVHRDLKPANIKLTADGSVKVLDFGLAKALGSDAADRSSLTTLAGDTRAGVIVGTAAYMSPEQARGLAVDRRTDIWAFGCVLYEMLTGRSAFGGHTVSDSIAAIIEREPDWSRLPERFPTGIQRLLRRCLTKDPKHRLRDIGDVRIELDEALAAGSEERPQETTASAVRRLLPWTVSTIAAAALIVWIWWNPRTDLNVAAVTRATVTLPANLELDTSETAFPLALSPDGQRLVYVAGTAAGTLLYVRGLGRFDAKPIAGTEGARYPFFSPDGQWVAFFSKGTLKRVSVQGGLPVIVCEVPAVGQGGTWGPDDTVVFASGVRGLMRVRVTGGTAEPIRTRDPAMDARRLAWPQFLPGGRALFVTTGLGLASSFAVLSLETGTWRELGRGFQVQYVPSGHLVFHASDVREGEIRAVKFDLSSLSVEGPPVPVLNSVFRAENGGGAYYAVAPNGTLVFAPGGHARTLVRVDRNGRRTRLLSDRRGFRMPVISPDGRYLAVTIDPRPSQIWVYDLVRGSGMPLETEGHSLSPVWTPDGRSVAYFSRQDMYWRPADGSAEAQLLLARDFPQYPKSWTKDGRVLIFAEDHPTTRGDVWMLSLGGEPRPLLTTAAHELVPRLSPDDRWLAYSSDESGRHEVYVRPFPNVNHGKWLVSTTGGVNPAWSRDGRELFYINGTAMYSVSVKTRGATFDAGSSEPLFTGPFETGSPQFDVSADGSFVMVEADPDAKPTQIRVVTNWLTELKRLVP